MPPLSPEERTLKPETEKERVPAAEVLGDLSLYPLPTGWTATGGIVLIKCIDEDGEPGAWAFRLTGDLTDEEVTGVLAVRAELALKETVESYLPPEA